MKKNMSAENNLKKLGLQLPPPFLVERTNRVRAIESNNYVFTSGHGPLAPDLTPLVKGKLGCELTVEQGIAAARLTGLNILMTLRGLIGSLDRVTRVVKVQGFVNCAPGFNTPSLIMNGFSDLMIEIFGDRGRHVRSAIGVAELYADMPVEIEVIFEVDKKLPKNKRRKES
jgi:enamine deaminase RidA (YjgF/YER057c/UK114 family)